MNDDIRVFICTQADAELSDVLNMHETLSKIRIGEITVLTKNQAIVDGLTKENLNVILQPEKVCEYGLMGRTWAAVQQIMAAGESEPPIVMAIPTGLPKDLPLDSLRACRSVFWHEWVDMVLFGGFIYEEIDKNNPTNVKIIANREHRVVYMSRSAIPYGADIMVKDLGIRAYRTRTLQRIVSAEPTPLEVVEHIPMLRGIELGIGCYLSMLEQQ